MKTKGILGLVPVHGIAAVLVVVGCGQRELVNPDKLPTCGLSQVAVQTADGVRCVAVSSLVNALAQAQLDCNDGELPVVQGGVWKCGAPASIEGGDITAVRVTSASGLIGGAEGGVADLAVAFAGDGTANTVARSDHGHDWAELFGMPSGFADNVDNDTLTTLGCVNGQVPMFDGPSTTWHCGSPAGAGPETDPTVNALAQADLSGCSAGQLLTLNGGGTWVCVTPPMDQDSLSVLQLLCQDGDTVVRQAGVFACTALPSGGGPGGSGDVTAVLTAVGSGLTGGQASGDVSLAVDFGGACVTGQASCSDHTHPTPSLSDVVTVAGALPAGTTITNVPMPVGLDDVVPKRYVDALGAGGVSDPSYALCCGPSCETKFRPKGWVCDDVGLLDDGSGTPQGNSVGDKIGVFLPEKAGYLLVPESGIPTIYEPGGTSVSLDPCATGWRVCSRTSVSAVMMTCGVFGSNPPSQWSCVAPSSLTYVFSPKASGVLKITDTSNYELLTAGAQPFAPTPVTVDCSAATGVPVGSPATFSFLCTR